MARIVIGGYAQDLTFTLPDIVCRAMQDAVQERLDSGKSLFLRIGGENNGAERQTEVRIGRDSALRFEYDLEIFPEVNDELAGGYKRLIEAAGGIILASRAEAALMDTTAGLD